MKASLKWLSQYVDLSGFTPEEIAEKLTYAGLECDGIEHLASGTNLVIGEIRSCVPHPDSDHLHVLSVDEGPKYGVHQIVCGAPNAREGLKVIVARPGAVLPEVTIAPSVIRGVESDGMCCSLLELGVERKFLSDKQVNGIEELASDAPVGEEDVLGYLGLDDTVIEVELLANRGDLLSLHGLAEEMGAILDRPVRLESFEELPETHEDYLLTSETEACPSFHGLLIEGVQNGPSPKWMQERLLSEGIRPLDLLVDIGNYAMLLTGQPVNMYDADKIKGKRLLASDRYEGKFVAFDGKEADVRPGELVIEDKEGVVSLAGILAAKCAAISETTTNVLVESAFFKGASIRHASSRLGLASESSSRFVKGLSRHSQKEAIMAIAALAKDLLHPKAIKALKPYEKDVPARTVIQTSVEAINARLGSSFDERTVREVLLRDHLTLTPEHGSSFEAEVPYWRLDLKGPEDLSEETIRLLGYSNIHSKMPTLSLEGGSGLSESQKALRSIRHYLRDNGLTEVLTYSLRPESEKGAFKGLGEKESFSILNPLTEDHKWLRTSLLPSLLEVASYNLARQNRDFALFEQSDLSFKEGRDKHLAIVLGGERPLQGELYRRAYDFYSVKGLFEGILALLRLNKNRFKFDTKAGEEFHPYRSERALLGKNPIAVYGELHPIYKEKLGLPKGSLAVLEIDLSALLSLHTNADKAVVPPRFPMVERDLALLLDKGVSYESLRSAIARLDKRIEKVTLFDLYEGEKIAEGKKSLAIHLFFRSEEGTLTESETTALMDKVTQTLLTQFGAEVRGC